MRGQLGTLLREECSKEQVGHLLPQLTFRGNASPSTGWQIEGMFNNENSKRKEEKCPAQNIFEVVSVFCVSASHPPRSLLRWLCHLQIHSLCSEAPVLQSTLCIFPVEAQNLISPFFSLGKYTKISGYAECHMVVSCSM